MATMKQIVPNLWFERQAEDAANFYVSIFPNSRILRKSHYGKEGFEIHKMPEGTVMTIEFELNGNRFVGLNGGPYFKFNEAVSFIVYCDTQDELDHYWNKLSEGGDKNAQQCGWLKDKFGLSWQVVPSQLDEMMVDPDKERAGRVMNAMLKMKKLDIAVLQAAYDGLVEQV
jgi:predicted 3-demethylubiquinone-9 3-methyltransferase (glyoxalase superfamily)